MTAGADTEARELAGVFLPAGFIAAASCRCGWRGARETTGAVRGAGAFGADLEPDFFGFAPACGRAALTAAGFFAVGFFAVGFFAVGFFAMGFFAMGFFAMGFFATGFLATAFLAATFLVAGFRGFAAFLPRAAPGAFPAAFAADLRTGCAELRAFAPCFALLPEFFEVFGATHRLLAAARRKGFRPYFNVAR